MQETPMTNKKRNQRDERTDAEAPPSADDRLRGLLAALTQLQQYLDERGSHTYELAQRFMANAKRDPSTRAYDERQATMLEYQHYIWKEIAGRVGQIRAIYDDASDGASTLEASSPAAPNASAEATDGGEG
jgi:hypothetical protein